MDAEILGLAFRGIERLVIVGAGFAAIFFGYKLFDRVVADRGSFEGAYGEWKIRLQRIAPGVFFAAFGVSVLVFALRSTVEFQTAGGARSSYAAPAAPAADTKGQDLGGFGGITAALALLNKPDIVSKLSDAEKASASFAVTQFLTYRDILIDRIWGEGWREKYYKIAGEIQKDASYLSKIPEKEANTYKIIQGAMGVAGAK